MHYKHRFLSFLVNRLKILKKSNFILSWQQNDILFDLTVHFCDPNIQFLNYFTENLGFCGLYAQPSVILRVFADIFSKF